ncbi:hypothetical protein TELCIR_20473 [Teladorsagia circumcincta]|uniref:Helitron helicase-like domain-containing protein n=1 Tax=Teladorsagia circumcincta TaxID=45464 RepID=A0A2G9TJL3_TELCI|nr:hypothetical protein TELCIR_20473 [Teladorsagia circumcincta]
MEAHDQVHVHSRDSSMEEFYCHGGAAASSKKFHGQHQELQFGPSNGFDGSSSGDARGRGPYCYRIHGQVYHRIGPLHPEEGVERRYGQIYILDTEMAAQQRTGDVRNADCDPGLMRSLSELISNINSYAQSFKMMSEVEQAEIALAESENRPPVNIRMVFEESRQQGLIRRQYDIPTANEVAVVYVGEDNDVPVSRSLAVHLRRPAGEQLSNIRDIDKICDPLTYPLLFPTGAGGWDPSLTNNRGGRITQKDYYSYLFSIRDSFNPILHAGNCANNLQWMHTSKLSRIA